MRLEFSFRIPTFKGPRFTGGTGRKLDMGKAKDNLPTGESGGIPWLTALRILEKAYPYFLQKRGIGFGKLIMKYQAGDCTITCLEPHTYRVQIAGSGITVTDNLG